MKIKTITYKGFTTDVMFADKGDWRDKLHTFYVAHGMFNSSHHKDYSSAVSEFEMAVDEFLSNSPCTIDELVSKLSETLVYTGYEDCEIDATAAKALIEGYLLNAYGEVK